MSPRKPLRTRRGGGRVVRGGDACVALVPVSSRLVPPPMGDASVPSPRIRLPRPYRLTVSLPPQLDAYCSVNVHLTERRTWGILVSKQSLLKTQGAPNEKG